MKSLSVLLILMSLTCNKMSELLSDIDLENIDPKAPLSAPNLLKLLSNQCSSISQSWVKHERDFTDDKIKTVINGFSDKINNLIDNVNRENSGLVDKIRDLETKLEAANDYIEKKFAEPDHRLDLLRNSLLTTFNLVQSDMKYLYSETLTCHLCAIKFQNHKDLHQHIHSMHAHAPCHVCLKCSKTFKNKDEFRAHSCNHSVNICQNQDEISPTSGSHMHDLSPNYQSFDNMNDGSIIECGSVTSNPLIPTCYPCQDGTATTEDCQNFSSNSDLNLHMESHHGAITSFICDTCGLAFSTECLLEEHTENSHQNLTLCVPVHCSYCDQTFMSMLKLNCHVRDKHTVDSPDIDITSDVTNPVSPRPDTDDICIPQVDGIDDTNISEVTNQNISLTSCSSAATSANLFVPYQLNQQRQVAKLVRDSKISDYEVTANDSDRNVTIQCSVGFYEAVAKPAISSLSHGFNSTCLGITICCTVVRKAQDQNNSTPGLLLRFEISGAGVNPSPAPLSIHLHHTQRKIQIQGEASMPDSSKAPIWFVKNFLRELFITQAKAKKYDIEKINDLVLNTQVAKRVNPMPTTSTSCSHCGKTFSSNSRPTSCPRCSQPKHSTKCAPCPRTSSSQQKTIPAAPGTALCSASSSSSRVSLLQIPDVRTTATPVPPHTPPTSDSATRVSNPSPPPTTTVPPTSTPVTLPLAPDIQALSSLVSTPQPALPTQSQPKRKSKRFQHPVLPLSPKSAEISFLKQELSSAQTKITMLDAEIDDLNKTIAIQKARLEIFENDQNEKLSNKYFQPEQRGQKSCSLTGCSSTPCCQRPPPSCCSAYHAHASPADISSSLINNLNSRLLAMSVDIKAVKDTLKASEGPAQPHPSCNMDSMSCSENSSPAKPTTAIVDAPEPPRDMSTNSIEEFIFSPQQENFLNQNVLTNQLH